MGRNTKIVTIGVVVLLCLSVLAIIGWYRLKNDANIDVPTTAVIRYDYFRPVAPELEGELIPGLNMYWADIGPVVLEDIQPPSPQRQVVALTFSLPTDKGNPKFTLYHTPCDVLRKEAVQPSGLTRGSKYSLVVAGLRVMPPDNFQAEQFSQCDSLWNYLIVFDTSKLAQYFNKGKGLGGPPFIPTDLRDKIMVFDMTPLD